MVLLGAVLFWCNFKTGVGWILHCEGQGVSVVFYVSELGGCCPTLSKFWCCGFGMWWDPHTVKSVRELAWVDAGTITYKFLQILVSTTIYLFSSINIYMETKSSNLCTCTRINCFWTLCIQVIYKRVVVTIGMTVHMASFHLNACNLSHLVSFVCISTYKFCWGVPLFVVP